MGQTKRWTMMAGAGLVFGAGLLSCGGKEETPPPPPPESEDVVVMRRLVAICDAARSFVVWEKRAPKAIEDMVYEGYLDEAYQVDPWGHPFVMAVNEYGELEFYSDGPDGKAETADDIEHFCQEWIPPVDGGEGDADDGAGEGGDAG